MDSQVFCGTPIVEFFLSNDPSQQALDPTVFEDGTATDSVFKVLYNEDTTKRGSYAIKYRVYQANYPSNFVVLDFPFVITVINPCENPVSIQSDPLVDQVYTITDTVVTYTIPEFVAVPDFCDTVYSFTVATPDGQFAF